MSTSYYKGIKIFIGVMLLLVVVAIVHSYKANKSRGITNTRQMEGGSTSNRNYYSKPNDNKSYCHLIRNEALDFLTKSTFKLNGGGFVKFDTRYNHTNGKYVPSAFIVSGGGYRLEGKWELSTNGRIYITDYRVVSGNFDASNNSKSRGSLNIECNGNLRGVLVDRNGNSTNLTILKSG